MISEWAARGNKKTQMLTIYFQIKAITVKKEEEEEKSLKTPMPQIFVFNKEKTIFFKLK